MVSPFILQRKGVQSLSGKAKRSAAGPLGASCVRWCMVNQVASASDTYSFWRFDR